MKAVSASTPARVGLLGNPSDGYGGRVIAFTIDDLSASVSMGTPADINNAPGSVNAPDWSSLVRLDPRELNGAAGLMVAAVRQFEQHRLSEKSTDRNPPDGPLALGFRSEIPRQAGLAGSSAIVLATLKVLQISWDMAIAPGVLAELALRSENEELGIVAGPQDRVVQAHGGLLDMSFGPEPCIRSLDASLLPPLLLAWPDEPGQPSGSTHAGIRKRFDRGDPEVLEAMSTLASLADEGAECLKNGQMDRLRELVDENFEIRANLFNLQQSDRLLIDLGRSAGAAVKFCGSGGAVVALAESEEHARTIEAVFRGEGHQVLSPGISNTLPGVEG